MTARDADSPPSVVWPDPSPLDDWWSTVMSGDDDPTAGLYDPEIAADTPPDVPGAA
ncbi:hypothetical protein [Gordonia insulae]|uniref:Uncharacterized protein n=1 Tax=Gordonia insulae TaxID=2420509 RepID=A0A3G8JR79_9ACTN|nr:hypothetical protein [Gordonia insulae]AZG47607.1 hypothetical protein D7316_04219 [Gordonia insulae]